uniref:Protein cornichon homolog 1 n=1 Tax=Rhizophora mucronata TaxID=61149 RepID=A0A2P2JGV6_RHIMU
MIWYLYFWFLCALMLLGLLAILFYELLALTDLEADQVNPFEATALINNWVLPEFALQGLLCLLFLLTGHWLMFLLALPLSCYHAMLFMKRQHLIDVTEVFRSLNSEKKCRVIKLVFYSIFLAIIMIRLVFTAFHVIRSVADDVHIS